VVEAGDILAGDDSVWWRFANGTNKHLTVWSDVNMQFIPEAPMLQTDHWNAEPCRQNSQQLPVGDDPRPHDQPMDR
jgi:hypothetical protein